MTNSPSTTRSRPTTARSRVLGDETLRYIARELVDTVRRNVTIDWTPPRERPRQPSALGQARAPQTRLPARQTGKSHPNGPGASGGAISRLDCPVTGSSATGVSGRREQRRNSCAHRLSRGPSARPRIHSPAGDSRTATYCAAARRSSLEMDADRGVPLIPPHPGRDPEPIKSISQSLQFWNCPPSRCRASCSLPTHSR